MGVFYCWPRELLLKQSFLVHLTAQDPVTDSFYSTNYLRVILINQKLTVKPLYLTL